MFKILFICTLFVLLPFSSAFLGGWFAKGAQKTLEETSIGGGTNCAACTIVLGLLADKSVIESKSIEEELDKICEIFPAEIRAPCEDLVNTFGPDVIKAFDEDEQPDSVCRKIKICTDANINLYPKSKVSRVRAFSVGDEPKLTPKPLAKGLDPWAWIKYLIQIWTGDHRPLPGIPGADWDRDSFASDMATTRGYNWRGRDCDDDNDDIYPGSGARPSSNTENTDWNCNGITGVLDGKLAKDALCEGTKPQQILMLGDSATAHFSISPYYLDPYTLNETTFQDIVDILLDEFDHPEVSYAGFYDNGTECYYPCESAPRNSYYQRIYENNRCVHRGYHTIAVNGERSSSIKDLIVQGMNIKPDDTPVIAFYQLIGNDVCDSRVPTKTRWLVTPAQFYNNTMTSLIELDARLPSGSTVVISGLADGLFLYETMHARIHPVGYFRKNIGQNITYTDVYDYLLNLGVSPCAGCNFLRLISLGMNSNATVRALTQEHAVTLNKVYTEQIMPKASQFKNIKLHYIDLISIIQETFAQWIKEGKNPAILIEPVDGFHPSATSIYLFGERYWANLKAAGIINAPNPNNAKISQLFGDQGGY